MSIWEKRFCHKPGASIGCFGDDLFFFFFFYIIQILRHLHDLVAHTTLITVFIMALSQLACVALVWEMMNLFSQHHKVVLSSGQGHVRSSALIRAQWFQFQFLRHQRNNTSHVLWIQTWKSNMSSCLLKNKHNKICYVCFFVGAVTV